MNRKIVTSYFKNISFIFEGSKTVLLLLLLIIFCSVPSYGSKFPRIVFENGSYNNILIALDPNIPSKSCGDIAKALNSTFIEASDYLWKITGQKASFGPNITLLIPDSWSPGDCNLGSPGLADVNTNYESADVKVSLMHPIARDLPWTEQHQGCGKSGESIFIPPSFLTNSTFSDKERGQILLHEWLKFRYGVFEEYGFYGDSLYSPCYERSGQVHFTSCSNPRLAYLENFEPGSDLSADKCKQLVSDHTSDLRSQLSNGSSSIMFAVPTMDINKNPELCLNVSHNGFVNSKQNSQCDRKSTGEIILNHADFNADQILLFKQLKSEDQKSRTNSERIVPHIHLVTWSAQKYAYAFLIEDSPEIKQYDRIRQVKQSIAQFVQFIDVSTDAKKVFLMNYNETCTLKTVVRELSDTLKEDFLSNIPDTISPPLTCISNLSAADTVHVSNNVYKSLELVFNDLNAVLENHIDWKWNVFLFTSKPPIGLDSALTLLQTTPHSLSVMTFDNSEDWLKWNSIPQTRKVLYLPVCTDGYTGTCSSKTSSILTDHLLEVLGDQYPRRFFQKIIEVEVKSDEANQVFQVPLLDQSKVKQFLLTFPRYSNSTSVSIDSPVGTCGPLVDLLNFEGVLVLNSSQTCQFQGGNWNLNVNGIGQSYVPHVLRGFIETTGGREDLIILPSLANSLSKQLYPSTQNMMVPVHVAVKNKDNYPIIDATVKVDIIFSNSSGVYSTAITLHDDGNDPDTTKYDGVYSSFLYGYSSEPSYHTGSIYVTTNTSSWSAESIRPGLNLAALLDDRLATKCCGSFVPVDTSSSKLVGPTFYSSTLPSFKLGESIPNPGTFPPSRIQMINKMEENNKYVQVKFTAPKAGFNGGTVNHYDVCALKLNNQEFLCEPIDLQDCSPVPSGDEQLCMIYKDLLRESFINTSMFESKATNEAVDITCGIRGVNIAGLTSPISAQVIDISVLVIDAGEAQALRDCNSISDGCLPIYVFWILIGCVAAMLIALLVIVSCWCCASRKGKSRETNSNPISVSKKPNYKHEQRDEDFVDKIHNARSKDGNFMSYGDEFDPKEVYRSPERDSPEPMKNTRPVSSISRTKTVSAGNIPLTRFQHQPSDVTVHDRSSFVDPYRNETDSDEMPVVFVKGSGGVAGGVEGSRASRAPDTSISSFQLPRNVSYPQQPQQQNEWSRRNNDRKSVPARNSLYAQENNRNSRQSYVYPDSTQDQPTTSFGVPSISSMVDMEMFNEGLNGHEPMYASVNRNGRRNPTPVSGIGGGSNRNSGVPLPPNAATVGVRNSHTPSHLHPNYTVNQPKLNSRPQSSQSLDSGFIRGPSPNSLPPRIRMDHFPSSESETYSEMSRMDGQGNSVPPPPPPMPTPKALASAAPRRRIDEDDLDNANQGSRSMSRTPPRDSRLGILAQMGPIPDRKSVLKPRQIPPPPPPPRTNFREIDSKPIRFNTSNSNVGNDGIGNEYNRHRRDTEGNGDDDNDSDSWDVDMYDEFDFNPGVSHV